MPALADSGCQVWWAPVRVDPAAMDLLDAAERTRCSRLRRPQDRHRYIAAHALLRTVVAAHLSGLDPAAVELVNHCPRCGEGDHGQPRILGPSGFFVSLTHAQAWTGVAITRAGPVGLDVELIDALTPIASGDAATVLSASEREWWQHTALTQKASVLATLWTRKEALLKAAGTGFQTDPQALTLSAPGEPARVLGWEGLEVPPAAALVDVSPSAGYAGALSVFTQLTLVVSEHVG